MPWDIRENFGRCTGAESFAVVKRDNDEVEGCHPTRDAAEQQLAALNAAENNPGDTTDMAETEEEKRRKRRRREQQAQGYDEVQFLPEPTFIATDPGEKVTGVAYVEGTTYKPTTGCGCGS